MTIRRSVFLTDGYPSAAENMGRDLTLLDEVLENTTRTFRFYTWQNPGLTYPDSRPLPDTLQDWDHSPRVTGGGTVFHAPGDLVFSCISTLDDPFFPGSLKGKLCRMTTAIQAGLADAGISSYIQEEPLTDTSNIAFCHHYFSPNELYVSDRKVLGLTLRKRRHVFIIQGALHLASNQRHFNAIPEDYHAYLTPGVPGSDAGLVRDRIFEKLGSG